MLFRSWEEPLLSNVYESKVVVSDFRSLLVNSQSEIDLEGSMKDEIAPGSVSCLSDDLVKESPHSLCRAEIEPLCVTFSEIHNGIQENTREEFVLLENEIRAGQSSDLLSLSGPINTDGTPYPSSILADLTTLSMGWTDQIDPNKIGRAHV